MGDKNFILITQSNNAKTPVSRPQEMPKDGEEEFGYGFWHKEETK